MGVFAIVGLAVALHTTALDGAHEPSCIEARARCAYATDANAFGVARWCEGDRAPVPKEPETCKRIIQGLKDANAGMGCLSPDERTLAIIFRIVSLEDRRRDLEAAELTRAAWKALEEKAKSCTLGLILRTP